MPTARTCVYVSNANSNELIAFDFDPEDGALRERQRVDVTACVGSAPPAEGVISAPMALDPTCRRLYMALRYEPWRVVCFAIAESGNLTHIGTGPMPHAMAYVATDRTGRFLLGASYPGALISSSPIRADGSVGEPASVVPTNPKAHAIATDPANRFVYVPELSVDAVTWRRFDAETGVVDASESGRAVTPPEGAGARHIVFHPNGRFVFVNGERKGNIHAFAYAAGSGRLDRLQTLDALPPGYDGPPLAADLGITPDGRFLYSSERHTDTIAGFAVDAETGLLSGIGHFPTEQYTRAMRIDPDGRWLLAVGQRSHHLTVLAIDPATGALEARHRYEMGRNPCWIEFVRFA